MFVRYDKSFAKSLKKTKDTKVKKGVLLFIQQLKNVDTIQNIPSVKKIKGFKKYYRYRFGNYRIGFEINNPTTITLIVIAKRNDIYKLFP